VGIRCDPNSRDCVLTTDRAVGVYCASGGRSGMAAQTLERLGYEAHNLGGLKDLTAAGARITR
jgi:rhodanese-related sulfurtransferase